MTLGRKLEKESKMSPIVTTQLTTSSINVPPQILHSTSVTPRDSASPTENGQETTTASMQSSNKRNLTPSLPRDFLRTSRLNAEACYRESMQVLQDPQVSKCTPEELSEIERVEHLRNEVLRWSCGWGGVAYWPISLDESYTAACEEDRAAEWFKEVLEHASHGRGLLIKLRSMVGQLPAALFEPHEVKELLRTMVEMVEMVTMGVTILNMHCSILPRNRWRVYEIFDASSGNKLSWSDDDDCMDTEESNKGTVGSCYNVF
jgi:hypothetical protein